MAWCCAKVQFSQQPLLEVQLLDVQSMVKVCPSQSTFIAIRIGMKLKIPYEKIIPLFFFECDFQLCSSSNPIISHCVATRLSQVVQGSRILHRRAFRNSTPREVLTLWQFSTFKPEKMIKTLTMVAKTESSQIKLHFSLRSEKSLTTKIT